MAQLSATISGFVRGDLTVETKVYPISLTSLRVKAAMSSLLPATPNGTSMGLVTGTPGTNAPTLQATDPGGTSASESFAFEFTLPSEYVDAGNAAIRVKGKCGTTVADGACTVDFQVYVDARNGTVGSDIMASTPYSINSLTSQQSDMTITPATLAAGSKLIVVGTVAANDAGDLGVMVPTIEAIELVLHVKG
jgi:hypothetical protein